MKVLEKANMKKRSRGGDSVPEEEKREIPKAHRDAVSLLDRRTAVMLAGGGESRQAQQRAKGKKTARERIHFPYR